MTSCGNWIGSQCDRLFWYHGESESALFDACSGQTHLLDFIARAALEVFSDGGSVGFGALCSRVAEKLDINVDQPLERYLSDLLERFEEFGFVNRNYQCPPSVSNHSVEVPAGFK